MRLLSGSTFLHCAIQSKVSQVEVRLELVVFCSDLNLNFSTLSLKWVQLNFDLTILDLELEVSVIKGVESGGRYVWGHFFL